MHYNISTENTISKVSTADAGKPAHTQKMLIQASTELN